MTHEDLDGTGKAAGARQDSAYRTLALSHLKAIAGLHACDPALLKRWVDRGELRRLPRRSLIARHGVGLPRVVLVLDGMLALGHWLGSPRAQLLSFIGPGEWHGLLPLLDGGPEQLDLMVHEHATCLFLPAQDILEAMQQHDALRQALLLQLAHANRLLVDRVVEAITLPLKERLLRQLQALAALYGRSSAQGVEITLRVSQENLAQILGTSRQQVNLELKQLERAGVLSVARGRLVVLRPQALVRAGYGHMPMTLRRGHWQARERHTASAMHLFASMPDATQG